VNIPDKEDRMEKDFIRVAGAATRAGVSQGTVRRWMDEGLLTKYKDERGRVWVDGNQVDKLSTPKPVRA
jgi:predicted site-specific integrase-resolvase